jgi:predicted nucleotidyltransferase
MLHEPTSMPIDVVLARPGLHGEFLARRRRVDIGGVVVPLISVEDLVATKILAARRKDLEDVRGVLLEQWERVDFDRIERVLSTLQAAVGDPKLERRMQRIVRQVRANLPPKKPQPRRRR